MDEIRMAFHDELDRIESSVLHLGALASEAVEKATTARLDADLALVDETIHDDVEIDVLTGMIEHEVSAQLARQQPMAQDLRASLAVLSLVRDLERIGANAVNI